MRFKTKLQFLSFFVVVSSFLLSLTNASAQVKVVANFGSRTYTAHPIPAGMFSLNFGNLLHDATAVNTIMQAGFTNPREFISIAQIYSTTTPSWSSLDLVMKANEMAGLHPIVVLKLTPSWLQPSPNPCAGISAYTNAPPVNISKWAQLAASVVGHLDKVYPGLATTFEIWNEPELQPAFCVADNSDSTRLKTYLSLYAATASAMRAQANLDKVTIKIGGPVIAKLSLASEWIGALLSNTQTAPNVNFVSFHIYLTGLKDIQSGMTWSTLYSHTQSTTNGFSAWYVKIANLVKNGHQPSPASTPIYITEYNDNWAFAQDCCRNSPTYSPLFNTVAVADFMNSVYSGAGHVPAKLSYFSSSAPPFCILGTWDTTMNCGSTSTLPYPQYYAFKLLASSGYLGLAGGGYMAASVSPATTQTGLMATAFYTRSKDAVVIVNPTGTAYSPVTVVADNPGYSSATGTLYLLNRTNGHISTQSLTLTPITGGYAVNVSVPAYSVVAVSIHP